MVPFSEAIQKSVQYLLIGSIQKLTYLIWRIMGAAIFDCIIRSCDLFDLRSWLRW